MLGLCYSIRVESAIRNVAAVLSLSDNNLSMPTELEIIAKHPFGVLHHKEEKSLLMRLSDGRDLGPIMMSAADLSIDEHAQLSTHQTKYETAHCTLGMVMSHVSSF